MKIKISVLISLKIEYNEYLYLVFDDKENKYKFKWFNKKLDLLKNYYLFQKEHINSKKILIDILYAIRSEKKFKTKDLQKVDIDYIIDTDIEMLYNSWNYYELKDLVQSVYEIGVNNVL